MTTSTLTRTIQPHNERPASVWSTGGPNYERISQGIADAIEHAVVRLDPKPGERVLDLSTGTGWASRLVARRGAQVTGVDIAEGLLDVARDKARAEGLAIEYVHGDAESLPFENGEFDAVISTFGVMFASRPEAAATELARVCRPGGRIALATWLSGSTVETMFHVMRRHVPTTPNPPAPSPFEWGSLERLRDLLGGAFRLRFEHGTSFYREPTATAAWDTFSTGYGPTRALASSLDEHARAALRRDFITFHEGFQTELGICVPREYWVTLGVRG